MASKASSTPAKNGSTNSICVEIYDQGYNLRGSDPEYVKKLAEYVDSKMRILSEQTQTVDSLRLAVLAALNIADEFHMLARKYETASALSQRATSLAGALDDIIEDRRVG